MFLFYFFNLMFFEQEDYGAVHNLKSIPNLVLLTDCPELQSVFLNKLVLKTIDTNLDLFNYLHFTDQHNGVNR